MNRQPRFESTTRQQAVSSGASQLDKLVYPRPPSSNSPYYTGHWDYLPDTFSQSGHAQLSQAQYSDSQEICDQDIFSGDVTQTDSSSHGHIQSQSLPSQDTPVLLQSRNLENLSLDSPSLSQGKLYKLVEVETPDYLRSNSFPLSTPPSLESDTKRDRASTFSGPYRSHPLSYYESQLTPKEKNAIIDDRCVSDTIIRHMRSWEYTALRGYGFTEAEVYQLKSDHQNQPFTECAYRAYLKWTQNKGYCTKLPLTAWTMLGVLNDANEHEAIHFLIQKLKQS